MLHLKFVIREFLSLIFIPNYFSFTTHRLKAQGSRLKVNSDLKFQCASERAHSSVLSPRYFKFILFLLIPCTLNLIPATLPVADAAQVTIAWDSNSEPDLEGYVIYRNAESPGPPYGYSFTLPEDDLTDPLHPMVTLTGLNEDQENHIALTAYDTDGLESSFSNAVCVEVVGGSVGVCANSSNPGSSSSGGGGGSSGACFISNAGYDSSTFSKFVAKPVIRSLGLALLFLLLVFIATVKFEINRNRGK